MGLIIKGVFVGLAQIVPGLSSSTLAVVMGIYDELILSLNAFFKAPFSSKHSFLFLFKLSLGAFLGILLFAKALLLFIECFPLYSSLFFMGLVLGSVPIIVREKLCLYLPRFSYFAIAFLFFIGVSFLAFLPKVPLDLESANGFSISIAVWLFFSGFVAAFAMLLPGLSGSFILLLMGSYAYILNSIVDFHFLSLLCVGFGAFISIFTCSFLIKYCLQRYPLHSYYAIVALLLASVVGLWPQGFFSIYEVFLGGAFFCFGFALIYFFSLYYSQDSSKLSV
ncbi:MAG: DUF368 domain-containing protein [bacterium]